MIFPPILKWNIKNIEVVRAGKTKNSWNCPFLLACKFHEFSFFFCGKTIWLTCSIGKIGDCLLCWHWHCGSYWRMRLWGALLGLLGLLLSLQCELRIVGCGRVRPRTIYLVLLPGLTTGARSDQSCRMGRSYPWYPRAAGYNTPSRNTGNCSTWAALCCDRTWWRLRTWVLRLVGNVVGRRLIVSMVTKMLWLENSWNWKKIEKYYVKILIKHFFVKLPDTVLLGDAIGPLDCWHRNFDGDSQASSGTEKIEK